MTEKEEARWEIRNAIINNECCFGCGGRDNGCWNRCERYKEAEKKADELIRILEEVQNND